MTHKHLVIMCFFIVTAPFAAPAFAQASDQIDALKFSEELEQERPEWLYEELESCPANKQGHKTYSQGYIDGLCIDQMAACKADCKKGDAIACYSLAVGIQSLERSDPHSHQALFTRACRLGHASGCTNMGAGMDGIEPDEDIAAACYIPAYKSACGAKDPWGCTMLAFELFKGEHITKNYDRALEVMSQSCQFGEEDPACSAALQLEEQIQDLLNELSAKE